jgi:Spy/CpxP family protein refolding chaperone
MKRLMLWGLLVMGAVAPAFAEDKESDDWMRGRLFAPELILQHRAELKLTDAQRDALRRELVGVQAKASEIDFEMLDLSTEVTAMLDRHPIDSKPVMGPVEKMLAAENRKKLLYLEMLIRIKNLLTADQVQTARTLQEREK